MTPEPQTPETQTRGENTRAEIILAAQKLFVEQGYHGTSMRQIAQAAGIAVGGIYNHFPNKDEVFVAVLDRFHPYHEVLPLLSTASHSDDIEGFVRKAFYQMEESLRHNPTFLNLAFIELVEFQGVHLSRIFESLLPQVMGVLQIFQRHPDSLRETLPLPIVLRTFMSLFLGYYLTGIILKDAIPGIFVGDSRDQFVDVFLNGVLKHRTANSEGEA